MSGSSDESANLKHSVLSGTATPSTHSRCENGQRNGFELEQTDIPVKRTSDRRRHSQCSNQDFSSNLEKTNGNSRPDAATSSGKQKVCESNGAEKKSKIVKKTRNDTCQYCGKVSLSGD